MIKNYKVVGSCGLALPDGQAPKPGDSFSADLPFELEAFLTQIGAVSVEPTRVSDAAFTRPAFSIKPIFEDKE